MYGGQIEKEFQIASFNHKMLIDRPIATGQAPSRRGLVAHLKIWAQNRRQPAVVSERVAGQQSMQTAH